MPLPPYFVGSVLSFSDGFLAAEIFVVLFFDRDDFRLGGCCCCCCLDSSSCDEEEWDPSPSLFAAVGNILVLREDLERSVLDEDKMTCWRSL